MQKNFFFFKFLNSEVQFSIILRDLKETTAQSSRQEKTPALYFEGTGFETPDQTFSWFSSVP